MINWTSNLSISKILKGKTSYTDNLFVVVSSTASDIRQQEEENEGSEEADIDVLLT